MGSRFGPEATARNQAPIHDTHIPGPVATLTETLGF